MTAQMQTSHQVRTTTEGARFSDAQPQALTLLLAEMQALSALLPGMPRAPANATEIEADFDNFPV